MTTNNQLYDTERTRSLNNIICETTRQYLNNIDRLNPPSPREIEQELLCRINDSIALENVNISRVKVTDENGDIVYNDNGTPKTVQKNTIMKPLNRLIPHQLAEIAMFFYHIVKIDTVETKIKCKNSPLAVYCTEGPNKGSYDVSERTLYRILKNFDYQLERRKFKDVCGILRQLVPNRPLRLEEVRA